MNHPQTGNVTPEQATDAMMRALIKRNRAQSRKLMQEAYHDLLNHEGIPQL